MPRALRAFLFQKKQQEQKSQKKSVEERTRENLADIKAKKAEEQRRIFQREIANLDEDIQSLLHRSKARALFAERVANGELAVPAPQPDMPGGDVVDFDDSTVVPYTRQNLHSKKLHLDALMKYMAVKADITASARHFGDDWNITRSWKDSGVGKKRKFSSKQLLIEARQVRDMNLRLAQTVPQMGAKQAMRFEEQLAQEGMEGVIEMLRMLAQRGDLDPSRVRIEGPGGPTTLEMFLGGRDEDDEEDGGRR